MPRLIIIATAIAVLGLHAVTAIAAAPAAPTSAGATASGPQSRSAGKLDIDKARIDRALAGMVSSGRAAGVSALVWVDGKEVYFGTAGQADREAARPMRRDTLAQIYSMTKPVTGVALMQLWEQGRFGLDDPLSRHLPEFAQTKVLAGTDAAGKPVLKAPDRPILVRDILRHTAGFDYGEDKGYVGREFARLDPLNLQVDLAGFGRRLAQVPLLFEPGSRWHYSVAVDVQALLVEKLSGQPFEDYVQAHVLKPLGMHETGWTQPEERFGRLAAWYTRQQGGPLQRAPDASNRQLNFAPRKLTLGGAGLVSSVDDYMRFARMLVNGGTLDGVSIIKPSTLRLMSTDQLDPRVTERSWLGGKGTGGFGIDFFVRTGQPKNAQENRGAVGEFFWDGLPSTLFWVDPANRLTAVFFAQVVPFDGTLHHDLRKAVYGSDYLGPAGD